MPGAADAVAAVRAAGGRVVVVSAKLESAVAGVLDHVGLAADVVVGERFGAEKGQALRACGAGVYVGDHPGDVEGARAARAVAVAVPTGPTSREELAALGPDVLLDDLAAFPAWYAEHLLTVRLADLHERLGELGGVLVALSGGVDSSFLLAAAVDALGPYQVVAATAVSPSLATGELELARELATGLGVRHVAPHTYEMARDGYRANAGDRCYFCKAELLDVLRPVAAGLGLRHVVTGTNADDALAGFRPGIRAADERGARTPLLDAGLTKAQVREASRRRGLATWDKPAAACLSSRIAYGLEVTRERLARVDRAEADLRAALAAQGLAVRDLRVRDLGDEARVEVDEELVTAVTASPEALAAVQGAGFAVVTVDDRGFRSGSLNELLPDPEPYR